MSFIFILIPLFICCVNGVPFLDGRIVGGSLAEIEKFPYQVSLQRKTFGHTCGGSIISYSYIVTAAHCVYNKPAEWFFIRLGSSFVDTGGQKIDVCAIYVHEKYDAYVINNDIAILELCNRIAFQATALPISLANENEYLKPNLKAVVSGWGYVREFGVVQTQLRQVQIPIVEQKTCINMFPKDEITPQMICAGYTEGGKDSCQGDSGGPLVAKGKLVGIVSWGYGCARPNQPGIYTRVSEFRKWIRNITNV